MDRIPPGMGGGHMADEVRVWEVGSGDELTEICRSKLNLEERIEKWIVQDISVLDPNLLVIGEQVETAFGKFIDLLCMDSIGNLVIVELKRDKTPREVTAQALDYASWVKDLEADDIQEIAAKYFEGKATDLESAFVAKFKTEFPEVVNEHHAMRVVAAGIDDSTERIIRYLSETYSVDINAVRFQFFEAADGRKLLARTLTVALEEAEANIKKRPGKRPPPPTPEEMENAASDAGVVNLYRQFKQAVASYFKTGNTKTTCTFQAKFPDGSLKMVFSLVPGESNADKGLRYQLYSKRLAQILGVDENAIKAQLPPTSEHWQYGPSAPLDMQGCAGYIKTGNDIQKIVDLLKQGMKNAGSA
jgi:hypothetical protein